MTRQRQGVRVRTKFFGVGKAPRHCGRKWPYPQLAFDWTAPSLNPFAGDFGVSTSNLMRLMAEAGFGAHSKKSGKPWIPAPPKTPPFRHPKVLRLWRAIHLDQGIECGFRPDYAGKEEQSLLALALRRGNWAMVRTMLRAGATPDFSPNPYLSSASQIAVLLHVKKSLPADLLDLFIGAGMSPEHWRNNDQTDVSHKDAWEAAFARFEQMRLAKTLQMDVHPEKNAFHKTRL